MSRSRNCSTSWPGTDSSNGTVPIPSRRCIVDQCSVLNSFTKTLPRLSIAVQSKSKINCFKSSDGLVSGWVGGLIPFIALLSINTPGQLRIAEFESESSISSSVVLELIKDRVKISIWIIRILVQSLIFAGKYYTPCTLMLEYLDIIRTGFLF